jgi:hypothetical protein
MTDAEMFAFMAVFNDLRRVFPLRGDAHEIQQTAAAYFKAMRRFPLDAVAAGAEAWIAHGTKWPKPTEWIASIPRRGPAKPSLVALTAAERDEYARAEALHYDDAPCRCDACREAGVDHRLVRFVPDLDTTGRDCRALDGDRVVTRGHWAHGAELAEYYRARDAFWSLCATLELRTPPVRTPRERLTVLERIAQAFAARPAPAVTE